MSIGLVPLTITVVGALAAVLVFRWTTARYTPGIALLGDAARAALVFAVCLWIPTLLFGVDNRELGRGLGRDLAEGSTGVRVEMGASSVGALFSGFIVMLTLLALLVVARAGRRGRFGTLVHGLFSGPIKAAGLLLLTSPLCGAIGYAAAYLSADTEVDPVVVPDGGIRALAAAAIAYAGNAGLWLIGVGVGAPFTTEDRFSGGGPIRQSERLWGAITEEAPGLWIAPLVALTLLVVMSVTVVRQGKRFQQQLRRDSAPRLGRGPLAPGTAPLTLLGVWLLSLLVVGPVVLGFSSVTLDGRYGIGRDGGGGTVRPRFEAGPDLLQSTVLILLLAVFIGGVVAAATGFLDANAVRTSMVNAASAMQSSPDGPPPAWMQTPAPPSPAQDPAPSPPPMTGRGVAPGRGGTQPDQRPATNHHAAGDDRG